MRAPDPRVGVSAAAPYRHFRGRQALLEAVAWGADIIVSVDDDMLQAVLETDDAALTAALEEAITEADVPLASSQARLEKLRNQMKGFGCEGDKATPYGRCVGQVLT